MQTDTTGRFKGMIDCGKQTIKHEGVRIIIIFYFASLVVFTRE